MLDSWNSKEKFKNMKQKHPKERKLFSVKPDLKFEVKKRNNKLYDGRPVTKKIEYNLPDTETLTIKNIAEGQIILGCVSQVTEYSLTISLPHKVHGNVSISSISKAYSNLLTKVTSGEDVDEIVYQLTELYPVGHLVSVFVKDINKVFVKNIKDNEREKILIDLSMAPKDINSKLRGSVLVPNFVIQVAVMSVEDHGYVLETGIPGVRAAFMKKSTSKKAETIGIGSVFLANILEVTEMDSQTQIDGTVPVKIKVDKLSDVSATSIDENTNVMTLLPGTLVDAEISSISGKTIKLKTSENTEGIVSVDHLQKAVDPLNSYKVGQEVKARLLYTTVFTHTMHFTLNESLQRAKISTQMMKTFDYDEIIKEATIVGRSGGSLHLNLHGKYHAYCPYNLLCENKADKDSEKFGVGRKLKCRVLGFNLMDQMMRVGVKASLINDERLSIGKFEPGMLVTAKVSKHTDMGINFTVGEKLLASAKFIHLTESCTTNIKTLFPIGKTVKGKILHMYQKNRSTNMHLTLKPSIVKSSLPIVIDYNDDYVDTITIGIVLDVSRENLVIGLFNGVKAILFQNDIPEDRNQNLKETFKNGQTLTVRVRSVNEEDKKMKVTMILDDADAVGGKTTSKKFSKFQSSSCEIVDIKESELKVKIDGKKGLAVIPSRHFSDSVLHSDEIQKHLRIGDCIDNCFLFRSSKQVKSEITLKPKVCRFLANVSKMGSSRRKLKTDDVVPAVVQNCERSKLSLRFPEITRQKLCKVDRRVIDNITEGKVFLGFDDCDISDAQTLLVKVLEAEEGKKPKISIDMLDVEDSPVEIMLDYFHSEGIIRNLFERSGGALGAFSAVKKGNTYNGTVKAIKKEGALIFVEVGSNNDVEVDGVLCFKVGQPKLGLTPGDIVEVIVVHVNYAKKCLYLELSGDEASVVVGENKKKNKKQKRSEGSIHKGFSVGSIVQCELVVNIQQFAIGTSGGRFIYICNKRHTNDFNWVYTHFKVGEVHDVCIRYNHEGIVVAQYDVIVSKNEKKMSLTKACSLPKLRLKPDGSDGTESNIKLYEGVNFKEEAKKRIDDVLDVAMVTSWAWRQDKARISDPNLLLNMPQFGTGFYFERIKKNRERTKKLKKLGAIPTKGSKIIKTSEREAAKVNSIEMYAEKMEDHRERFANKGEKRKVEELETPKKKLKKKKKNVDEIAENFTFEDLNGNLQIDTPTDKKAKALPLAVPSFSWFDDSSSTKRKIEESSSDSDNEEEKEQKKSRKLTKAERIQKIIDEENRVHKTELTRLDKDREPENAMDYEELLQSSPNSSAVWIQFISYHLQNAEIEKARAVSRRALQTVSACEEKERMNIWTVLLQLEVLYGDRDSVDEALEEALTTNDQKKVYSAMAHVYADADKVKEADKTYATMIKKFSQDKEVWIEALQFHFKKEKPEKAREYLDKSLLTLPKKDQIDVIHRFSQLEFQCGDVEKGKIMYESLVSNFPKRLDIWNVYADMLIKVSDMEGARRVLQRMSLLKLRLPKMRSVFKRLLKFEQEHGTSQSVEEVKNKVEEYVNAALKEEM